MSEITITELEQAINYWRNQSPASGDELTLCRQASALSRPYALLIVQRRFSLAESELDAGARDAWTRFIEARERANR